MPDLAVRIIGREPELASIRDFVESVTSGPASLTLQGPAGIGKTAIWRQGTDDARDSGLEVLACRCTEAEAGWAFAGLGDLFDGLAIDDFDLPEVQRSALAGALLRGVTTSASPGDRAVGVAVLGVLRVLARTTELLLAIDDVQWLDISTRKVLSFALRRLDDEPVRLLTSLRTGASIEPDLGLPGDQIVVGPMSVGTVQRIVQATLGHTVARPTLTRLHRATGGNPMMCLEMARALQRRGVGPWTEETLPVPADLRKLVNERLQGLSDAARQLLLFAGALAHPTVAALAATLNDEEQLRRALTEAVDAGVIDIEPAGNRVHVTHPLIASIPYADLLPAARRELHERLAATVTDPEQHARHAALATEEPASAVAAALDVAAGRARARGSIDAAAELAELALARTPPADHDEQLRRTVEVARFQFLLGDVARARTTIGRGLDAAAPGPFRVRGLLLQATIASWEQGDATVAALCAQAMTEAGDDPLLRALCHATLADTSPSGAALDLVHAETAVHLLDAMDHPPKEVLAGALTNLACNGCRLGQGLAVATLERAVGLQADAAPVPTGERATMGLGMYLKVIDRFAESRTWLHALWTSAVDEGDDSALPLTLGHLATLECWAGNYHLALDQALEGREHAARMGLRAPMPQSAHVLALAHLGRLDEARALARRDLTIDESHGYVAAAALHLRSLGFTELAAGNHAAAAEHLLRALQISSVEIGVAEPAILRLHGDAVEALAGLGRIDDAHRLIDQLDESTRANALPWSTAIAERCRGILASTAGEQAAAIDHYRQALAGHERLPMPFEAARTTLLLGRALRRIGHRNDARRELDAALDTFTALDTPVQAAQARAEIASLGGRSSGSAMTAVEERIATLVADGRTNREVAGVLFLSVRTVESHLGRIYRKLGLRSRTELARRLTP